MKTILFLIVSSYLATGMIQSIGVFQLFSVQTGIALTSFTGLIALFVFVKKSLTPSQIWIVSTLLLLCLYSALTSPHVVLSFNTAFRALCSGILFITLSHIIEDKPSVANAAKHAFICFALAHAVALILFYLFQPERTTGLMDDFSQASMLLLLAYLMAYPTIKEKAYFSAFSLIIFVAYFTTFSRTANFLLLLALCMLILYEIKQRNIKHILKLALIAIFSLVFVYSYPQLIGEVTVDRGGFSHFSTLNSRTIYWQTAWQAILQKPFSGHGLGMYAWTGIKEAQPFNIIYFVHNDYLQILHDLGIIWLVILFAPFFYLLVKHSPVKLGFRRLSLFVDTVDERKLLAWISLVSIALYMSINFLITNLEFQVAIVILLADLLRKRHA